MRQYPYLGRNYVDGLVYVVFFTEHDTGVIVLSEITNENIYFGKYGEFDEEKFEVLPPELCVRLQN